MGFLKTTINLAVQETLAKSKTMILGFQKLDILIKNKFLNESAPTQPYCPVYKK